MSIRTHIESDWQADGVRILWVRDGAYGSEAVGWPAGGVVPALASMEPEASFLRWERYGQEDRPTQDAWRRGVVITDTEAQALLAGLLAHYGVPQAESTAQAAAAGHNLGQVERLEEALAVERKRVDDLTAQLASAALAPPRWLMGPESPRPSARDLVARVYPQTER